MPIAETFSWVVIYRPYSTRQLLPQHHPSFIVFFCAHLLAATVLLFKKARSFFQLSFRSLLLRLDKSGPNLRRVAGCAFRKPKTTGALHHCPLACICTHEIELHYCPIGVIGRQRQNSARRKTDVQSSVEFFLKYTTQSGPGAISESLDFFCVILANYCPR